MSELAIETVNLGKRYRLRSVGGGSGDVSYSWDFGDGSEAGSGASAAHVYSAAGAFTVSLTAVRGLACS